MLARALENERQVAYLLPSTWPPLSVVVATVLVLAVLVLYSAFVPRMAFASPPAVRTITAPVAPAFASPSLVSPAASLPSLASPCPGSGRATILEGALTRFSSHVGAARSLRIVAIGSSSTAGAGATSAAGSYPNRLRNELESRFPNHRIEVVNAGINGQEVPDMLARLDRDVLAHRPDLVVWQFGSNGLMRGRSVALMEAAAVTGIERIKAAGADVVLMDLQHAPRIDRIGNRDEILQMMERIAAATGSALFRRHRLMKAWASALGEDYARMVAPDQLHMNDTSYRCMAGALASSLEAAAKRYALTQRERSPMLKASVKARSMPALRPELPPGTTAESP